MIFIFSLFSLVINAVLALLAGKETYYKTFSHQENRFTLPQGFNDTSFIKVSFPFTIHLEICPVI